MLQHALAIMLYSLSLDTSTASRLPAYTLYVIEWIAATLFVPSSAMQSET